MSLLPCLCLGSHVYTELWLSVSFLLFQSSLHRRSHLPHLAPDADAFQVLQSTAKENCSQTCHWVHSKRGFWHPEVMPSPPVTGCRTLSPRSNSILSAYSILQDLALRENLCLSKVVVKRRYLPTGKPRRMLKMCGGVCILRVLRCHLWAGTVAGLGPLIREIRRSYEQRGGNRK